MNRATTEGTGWGSVQMVMPWQVSEIGAKATELAGRVGNSRPFHVSPQPLKQIENRRLKSNCSLLVPACGSLSLSAGQQSKLLEQP